MTQVIIAMEKQMEYKLFELLSMKEPDEQAFKALLNSWNPISREQFLDDPVELSRAFLYPRKKSKYHKSRILSCMNTMNLSELEWDTLLFYIERLQNIQEHNKKIYIFFASIISIVCSSIVTGLFLLIPRRTPFLMATIFPTVLALCANSIFLSRFDGSLNGLKNLSIYIKMQLNKKP